MTRTNRKIAASLAALSVLAPFGTAFAQSSTTIVVHKKPNIIQRHPTATGFVAGAVTHHMLKKSAAYKKAHGQKLNWAERHPTLSAIGVGLTTRAVIKKTTPSP